MSLPDEEGRVERPLTADEYVRTINKLERLLEYLSIEAEPCEAAFQCADILYHIQRHHSIRPNQIKLLAHLFAEHNIE